jgi:hypothetical protein
MSVEAITWAFSQRVNHAGAKLLLVALANYANEDWEAYPSQLKLCAICDMSERAMRDNLTRLMELGCLKIERYKSRYGNHLYVLDKLRKNDRQNLPVAASEVGSDRQNSPVVPAESADSTGRFRRSAPAESADNTKEEIHQDTKEETTRCRDAAADLFAFVNKEKTGVPYGWQKADFFHLTRLRKAFGIDLKESPPDWEIAVLNYFASPMGKYTLADLSNRYSVFKNSPLNQYGKPTTHAALQSPLDVLQDKIRREMEARRPAN